MKCGHCQRDHDTVAEVRACSQKSGARHDKPRNDIMPQSSSPLRPKQVKFLSDLLRQLGLELTDDLTPETISYQVGQPIISKLVDARRLKTVGKPFDIPSGTQVSAHPVGKRGSREPTLPPIPDVPDGFYALPGTCLDYDKNDLYFCSVEHKGDRIYVNQRVGGEKVYGMKLPQTIAWLNAIIDFGVEESTTLYGREMKCCCKCGLSLTKWASRQVLHGRKCAYDKGFGEEWDDLNKLAIAKGLDEEQDAA